MIPKTLAEFRALMQRVADVRVNHQSHDAYAMQLAGQAEAQRHAIFAQQLAGPQYTTTLSRADADALRALAAVTPEQLLGIVGRVEALRHPFVPGDDTVSGYVVTPSKAPA